MTKEKNTLDAKGMRQKLLAYQARKPIPSGILLDDGTEVFVLKPTINERTKVLKYAGVKPGSEDVDVGRMVVGAALYLACDANGNLIFDASDAEAMLSSPIGELIERVGSFAAGKMNVDAGVVEKN